MLIREPNARNLEATKELIFMKTLHETTRQNIFKEAEEILILTYNLKWLLKRVTSNGKNIWNRRA